MKRIAFAVIMTSFALTGCTAHAVPTPSTPRTGMATIILRIPHASAQSGAKTPKYISPATASVKIQTANGSIGENVTPGSPNCISGASATTCTFNNIGAPIGTSLLSIDAYDKPLSASGGFQGNIVSSGGTMVTIAEGQTNRLQLALGGVIAKAQILSLNASPVNGAPTDLNFSVKVTDADGYTIVGSQPYALAGNGYYGNPLGVSVLSYALPNPVQGSYDFTFTENGVSNTNGGMGIVAPSDTYSIAYSGKGVISATLAVGVNGLPPFATAVISPQPAVVQIPGAPAVDESAHMYVLDDKTIWFTEPSKKAIAYLTSGVLHEFTLPSGHTPTYLAFATSFPPNVEFVFATQENTVGTIDSSGTIKEYTPTLSSAIGGLGYDVLTGDLVLTEPGAGKVASFNLAGFTKEYALPAGAIPGEIFGGYWVDPGTNAVGTLNVQNGTVREYPLPTPNSNPTSVMPLSSAQVWVAEGGGKRVAVIDPGSGNVTEYPTADALTSITGGDQGRIIAATDVSGNIEFFDTSGNEHTFVTGANGPASEIGGASIREGFPFLCPTCLNGIQEFLF